MFNWGNISDYITEAMKRFMKDFPSNPFCPPKTTEQEFSPDSFSEIFEDLLQQGMASFFTGQDPTSAFGPPKWAPPLREPECAFCHSKAGTLKRCMGCKKVFYCGKECQTQHWKEHRPDCQMNS